MQRLFRYQIEIDLISSDWLSKNRNTSNPTERERETIALPHCYNFLHFWSQLMLRLVYLPIASFLHTVTSTKLWSQKSTSCWRKLCALRDYSTFWRNTAVFDYVAINYIPTKCLHHEMLFEWNRWCKNTWRAFSFILFTISLYRIF